MTNQEVFSLLQDYVFDARALRLNFFPDWDGDIREVDLGVRTLFTEQAEYDALRQLLRELRHDEILSLRDWLQVRMVLFRSDTDRGFYSVGPFRSKPFTEGDYRQLQSWISGVSNLHLIQNMLNPIPVNISELEALTLARQILLRFFRIAQPVVLKRTLAGQAPQPKALSTPEGEDAFVRHVEEVYARQDLLMAAVAAGDYNKALAQANTFITKPPVIRAPSNKQQSTRDMLHAANTSCRLAAQKVGIHPVHLDELSQKYIQIISSAITEEQLVQTYLEMLYEYCRLCREYPARGCSPTLQKIVNYIGLNISNDLTLDKIAGEVNFSVAYIIKKFREELHTTPTAYITAQRLRIARDMLAETNLSVHEVAQYVGIDDWNYFSKLFKKETGRTPSAYRKEKKGK